MNKLTNDNSLLADKQKVQLLNSLVKSVAGLVGIVVIMVGLVLSLVFLPEISTRIEANAAETIPTSPAPNTTDSSQLVDGKDVDTGLLAGDGLELVKGNCTVCHSSALILQNRFSREGWHEKIVWMQETQGLWDLGENEAAILDYLAENYSPGESHGRRIPLSGIDWYELKD